MAKELDPKTQAAVNKAVAAALRAERRRVADAVKGVPLPGTAREAGALRKALRAAVAAPAA